MMKNMLIWLVLVLPLPLSGALQNSITRNTVTWTFDKEYECGRFITGDWWVVGPVDVVAIDPPCTDNKNGSMVDPVPGSDQGYQENAYGYDASVNAGADVSAQNPLTVSPGSRLISSVFPTDSILAASEGSRWNAKQHLRSDCVWAAAILTVVASPPPDSSFRPGYCDTAFTVHSGKGLRTDLLHSLAMPAGATEDIAEAASWFEHPWLEHKQGWSGSHIHPQAQMPFYGREISRAIGIAAQLLHLDIPLSDKEPLLHRFIQYGIDIFSVAANGGRTTWRNDGGHASGRKWPIMFAGFMLDHAGMKSIGKKSGDYLYADGYGPGDEPPDYLHFGEDDQTFYVTREDVDRTNSPEWRPDTRAPTAPYDTGHIGLPEWGIGHSHNPWADNASWDANYRRCCTAICWQGWLLAAHIMNARDLWNHDVLFDYVDRYMAVEKITEDDWRSSDLFTRIMWDTYRADYGCVWTMTDTADTHSQGTMDCSGCKYHCTGIVAALPDAPPGMVIRSGPGRDGLYVTAGGDGSSRTVRLYDHRGVCVRRRATENGRCRLDVSGLANGVYYLGYGAAAPVRCVVTR